MRDPQLARLGPDDLIRQQRTPRVPVHVEHPGRRCRISPLMSAVTRSISVSEVPGGPLSRTSRSVSLNSGVKERPRNGTARRPTRRTTPTRTKTGRADPSTRVTPRSYRGRSQPNDRRLPDLGRRLGEQRQAERRRHEQGDHHGRDHGHGVGDGDRGEERAERASGEEDRVRTRRGRSAGRTDRRCASRGTRCDTISARRPESPLPSARRDRMRRATFSASPTASSITTTSARISPPTIIELNVVWVQ